MTFPDNDPCTVPHLARLGPAPDLRPFVRRYTSFRSGIKPPPLMLPAWNKQKLVLHFGSAMMARFGDAPPRAAAQVTLSGACTRPHTVSTDGACMRFFAVELTPVGYLSLFRHHGSEVLDRILSGYDALPTSLRRAVPLDEVACSYLHPLVQQRAVESWLRRNLAPDRELYRLRHVANAVRLIEHRCGNIRMRDVAAEVGVSLALLRRQFRQAAGLPPKQYALRTRDGLAFNRMMDRGGQSTADLAFDLGYADQSHMIRSVQRFVAGTTGDVDLKCFLPTRLFT